MPETKDLVKHNMKGIAGILNDADADVCFLQEVDIDSKRSYHINEKTLRKSTGCRWNLCM